MSFCVMLPAFSFASQFLHSTPDLASKEQIGDFNYYKLIVMYLLGYNNPYAISQDISKIIEIS